VSATIDTSSSEGCSNAPRSTATAAPCGSPSPRFGRDTMEGAEHGMRVRLDELLTFVDDPVLVTNALAQIADAIAANHAARRST
jgi:hypothetical protein